MKNGTVLENGLDCCVFRYSETEKNQSAKLVLLLCLRMEGLSWLQNLRVNKLDLKDDRLQRLKLFYLYAEKSYSKLDF